MCGYFEVDGSYVSFPADTLSLGLQTNSGFSAGNWAQCDIGLMAKNIYLHDLLIPFKLLVCQITKILNIIPLHLTFVKIFSTLGHSVENRVAFSDTA